ncbi:MAG: hypothetical protein ACU0C9_07380, partial [Paracoccaceae bacterium]
QPRVDQNQQQQNAEPVADLSNTEQPELIVPVAAVVDSGLVETPEQAPVKRRPRKPKPAPVAKAADEAVSDEPKAAE